MSKYFIILLISPIITLSQSYAPQAGEPGSTAIDNDDNAIVSWATGIELKRGYLDIQDTLFEIEGNNKVSYGTAEEALGFAQGNSADVVSLGDAGEAILTFENKITNGVGADFAVFENGFDYFFLELAFVEVSSDGINYVRFPSHSETQTMTQTSGFGSLQPTRLYNFAGKYEGGYGTPFDLEELVDSAAIDVNNINYVKIIDVVGSIGDSARYDAQNNKINDPYPTPYASGGFDLDGVGVIHQIVGVDEDSELELTVYPNPSKDYIKFSKNVDEIEIFDVSGRLVLNAFNSKFLKHNLSSGSYTIIIKTSNSIASTKLIVE